jgi:two-component system nitrogen regulation response regulator NtrX
MARHNWPGNVRELRNFIERIVIMVPEEIVTPEIITNFLPDVTVGGLQTDGMASSESGHIQSASENFVPLDGDVSFKEAKKAFEKEFLKLCLQKNKGNISQTAEQVGLERSHLHKKIKNLGLEE